MADLELHLQTGIQAYLEASLEENEELLKDRIANDDRLPISDS